MSEKRYIFQMDYISNVGAWSAGDVVTFSDEVAAWLLRDVPGVIAPWTSPSARKASPDSDRQVKTASNRGRRKRAN